jgi:hypothetical protein
MCGDGYARNLNLSRHYLVSLDVCLLCLFPLISLFFDLLGSSFRLSGIGNRVK